MNVWLSLPFLAVDELVAVTRAAAEAGVTGVALSDHICVPASIESSYPYRADGQVSLPTSTPLPEPLVAIAGLAGAVEGIRFMTAILVAPLRHPIALANDAATAAAMSGGRLDLGLGAGWLREEFEALGLGYFDQRGKVTEEMIGVMRRLWTGDAVAHSGTHFQFPEVAVNPTPPTPIPIFLGGHSGVAIRRCAALADGWVGVNPTIEELEQILPSLAEARRSAGTEGRAFEVRTGIKGAVSGDRVRALKDLGVSSLLLAPWQMGERRDSVFEQPVEAIVDALPGMVDGILAA